MTQALEQSSPQAVADTSQERVSHWLRDAIRGGAYPVGGRIPTAQELAAQFGTSTFTIHRALEPLVADGLLERRRRLGTFVRNVGVALKCAGVYFTGNISGTETAFCRCLNERLKELLAQRDVAMRLWYGEDDPAKEKAPPESLVQAAANREIQCLVSPLCSATALEWMDGLGLATAMFTPKNRPGRVDFGKEDFVEKAVEALARRGCRRLGVVTNIRARGSDDAPLAAGDRAFHATLAGTTLVHGLAMRPEWLVTPESHPKDLSWFGYDAFRRLWQGAERPDGVIVYPDVAAQGVVAAILALGVRVPDELHVAFHRNEGVDIFAPFPYVAVESSPAEGAAALMRQVDRQLLGDRAEPEILPHRVVE